MSLYIGSVLGIHSYLPLSDPQLLVIMNIINSIAKGSSA